MAQYKTPGVYVVEQNAFPNSVVEVATAVPAFIGFTKYADNKGTSLANKPWRISSMAEFETYYGGPPAASFTITKIPPAAAAAPAPAPAGGAAPAPAPAVAPAPAAASQDPNIVADFIATDSTGAKIGYTLDPVGDTFILYYSMMLFFQNGGGACYIVSVGNYNDGLDGAKLSAGIATLLKEQEPTMVVIPEAVHLKAEADCADVQNAALLHCGFNMRNRFAVLDVFDGYKERQDKGGDCIEKFRDAVGIVSPDYGAAYYPWVNTSIVKDKDIDFTVVSNANVLQGLLTDDLAPMLKLSDKPTSTETTRVTQINAALTSVVAKEWSTETDAKKKADAIATLNKTLVVVSNLYQQIVLAIQKKMNLMPPSGAMAGIYTRIDNTRGVWKAPANVGMIGVVSPAVNISHDEQADLNVTTQGKSINAIRSFIGEGVLVWGARTLDGNSLDWRYINVRRTMIMIEESVKQASKAYVFEPNVANTWVTIKSMVRNFLTSVWKRGGLAGASPDDAFSVFVGLGETMTADDILEGLLKVTVLVAVSRPAEFIEITFEQQMQKS
jgi:phage tail sheath protein FI